MGASRRQRFAMSASTAASSAVSRWTATWSEAGTRKSATSPPRTRHAWESLGDACGEQRNVVAVEQPHHFKLRALAARAGGLDEDEARRARWGRAARDGRAGGAASGARHPAGAESCRPRLLVPQTCGSRGRAVLRAENPANGIARARDRRGAWRARAACRYRGERGRLPTEAQISSTRCRVSRRGRLLRRAAAAGCSGAAQGCATRGTSWALRSSSSTASLVVRRIAIATGTRCGCRGL